MGIESLDRKTAHMRCRHGVCGRFYPYFLFEYPFVAWHIYCCTSGL